MKELLTSGVMIMIFVKSCKNIADLLTKIILSIDATTISRGMGLKILTINTLVDETHPWVSKTNNKGSIGKNNLLMSF